jgi:hypothetical protein
MRPGGHSSSRAQQADVLGLASQHRGQGRAPRWRPSCTPSPEPLFKSLPRKGRVYVDHITNNFLCSAFFSIRNISLIFLQTKKIENKSLFTKQFSGSVLKMYFSII